jgi:hypothetical protein
MTVTFPELMHGFRLNLVPECRRNVVEKTVSWSVSVQRHDFPYTHAPCVLIANDSVKSFQPRKHISLCLLHGGTHFRFGGLYK